MNGTPLKSLPIFNRKRLLPHFYRNCRLPDSYFVWMLITMDEVITLSDLVVSRGLLAMLYAVANRKLKYSYIPLLFTTNNLAPVLNY